MSRDTEQTSKFKMKTVTAAAEEVGGLSTWPVLSFLWEQVTEVFVKMVPPWRVFAGEH